VSEPRTLRNRFTAISDAMDRAPELPPEGAAAVLAQTTTVDTYPTTASAFYACKPVDIDGDESEGASATYTTETMNVFYAWNAGTTVPGERTTVICHAVGGRWVFRFDS
jgi:hypothetical protein